MYEIDPWGERRADIREACIGAAAVSMWAKDRVKPGDLIPEYDQGEPVQDQALGLAHWRAFVAQHNAVAGTPGNTGDNG